MKSPFANLCNSMQQNFSLQSKNLCWKKLYRRVHWHIYIYICGTSFRRPTRHIHYNVIICTSCVYRVCEKILVTGDKWHTNSENRQTFTELLLCNRALAIACSNWLTTLRAYIFAGIKFSGINFRGIYFCNFGPKS